MSCEPIILRLAAQHRGLVTTAQLEALGVSRHAVLRRVRTGLLRRLFTGVYLVGPNAPPHAREIAALLACGGGVLSHLSAAAVLQYVRGAGADDPVHVTVPPDCGRGGNRRGIRIHRSLLRSDEVITFAGCTLTTPVRTLLDLAGVLPPDGLERALARAERADPSLRSRLLSEMRQRPHRRGIRQLRTLVQGEVHLVRSEAEAALLRLLRRAGLPLPGTNALLLGLEVDFLWREQRLVVEVDGFNYHGSRSAMLRDYRRDAALLAAGFRVLRLAAAQVSREPERVIALLAQALSRSNG